VKFSFGLDGEEDEADRIAEDEALSEDERNESLYL